ncbi:MAG TPA: hypothetical protein VJ827_09330 [Rubrobacter sp.]|nr:hypothetical protein [Rubrobacter sp.]
MSRVLGRKAQIILALAGLAVTLTFVLVGCGSAGTGGPIDKSSSATRTGEGGGVSVAATWKGRRTGPVFEVAMDTHSVDLTATL